MKERVKKGRREREREGEKREKREDEGRICGARQRINSLEIGLENFPIP